MTSARGKYEGAAAQLGYTGADIIAAHHAGKTLAPKGLVADYDAAQNKVAITFNPTGSTVSSAERTDGTQETNP